VSKMERDRYEPGALGVAGRQFMWIRLTFWVVGLLLAGVLAYTGRHFLNSDAITFIEMGEGLRYGQWWKLTVLAGSPLYAILLGIAQAVLNTTPMNELAWLKSVGVLSFIAAMAACDLLLSAVRKEWKISSSESGDVSWFVAVAAIMYSLFLVCSLVWIKVRLMNPDMLAFFIVLLSMKVLVWMKEEPNSYYKYMTLGICLGLGYVTKTYLFAFSPVFVLLAGWIAGSARKAVPRLLVCVTAMLIVSAPLIGIMSYRIGHLSIGAAGSLAYTSVAASQGVALNRPEELHEDPKVLLYQYPWPCTDAAMFDSAHWRLGLEPSISAGTQAKAVIKNLGEFGSSSAWLFAVVLLFLGAHWRAGSLKAPTWKPPPLWLILCVPGVCGIGLFALVHLEMRYVAPFVFLLVSGLVLFPRYGAMNHDRKALVSWAARLMVVTLLAMLVHGAADQTRRALESSARVASFEDAFQEYASVKRFLSQRGVTEGLQVGVVGSPPTYWARMARLRIVARVPDTADFLKVEPATRSRAVGSLARCGVKALVGRGSAFAELAGEGWQLVPGTREYFVLFPSGTVHGKTRGS
jgi:hypothetical protein